MGGPEDDTNAAVVTDAGGDAADIELPKAVVQRIVRSKVVQMIESKTGGGGPDKKQPNVQLAKDALLALSKSGKVFINYLASTANDVAKEGKRVTISASDVFKALEELEFGELVQPLQQYLEAHKSTLKEKPATAKKKEGGASAKKTSGTTAKTAEGATTTKKRKTTGTTAAPDAAATETAVAAEADGGEEVQAAASLASPVPMAAMQQDLLDAEEGQEGGEDAMQE